MDWQIVRPFQHLLETDDYEHKVIMHLSYLLKQAEESECHQYVCPGLQCLVLGDSKVGKTSLVRSLTGERFDTEQTKTQGIEERIVDNDWSTLKFTKGHVPGNLIPYFKEALFRSMSFGTDSKEPLSDTTKLDFTALFMMICLYTFRIKGLLSVIRRSAFHFCLVLMSLSHILLFTASSRLLNFANQSLRSMIYIFVLIQCALLIRCTLKGIFLSGVVGVALAVLMTCYQTGIFERQQFWEIINFSVLMTDIILYGVEKLHLLFEFTAKWFQNHNQGTSPHPGQGKFEFRKIQRALALLSLVVIAFTGFSITMTPLLLLPFTNDLQLGHAHHHIFVGGGLCSYVFLSAQFALIAKVLQVDWTWKALIVFMVIISSIGVIPSLTTKCCILFFCSIAFLVWHLMYLYKISPVEADIRCSVVQIMNASFDAPLYTSLSYLARLKLKAYRKGKFLNLKLLDFVGDREYYSYHHLFFRHEALYLIVFNLSEFANENFKDVSTHIQRLQFWLKSICSRVLPHCTQILLVGTHREKLDVNCIKILNGHFKRFLSANVCAKVMENDADRLVFFPVENTLANKDTGIKELQSKIMSLAIKQQKRIIIEHNIPLEWILIQDVIMKHKISSDDTFCVSLDEFQRMIMEDFVLRDKCGLSKDMLKYFHNIGLIIYVDKKQDFDLSNWILVCPEKLIDIFINISSKPAESTKDRGSLKYDWKLLQSKGILTKQLLQSLLSTVEEEEEAVIAFLEYYGLICSLKYKGIAIRAKCDCVFQPTHFVPSLLPLSANGDTPVWHNNDGDKTFYVFFCNFLPEALFHQLLSRAQKHSTLEFRNGKTVLYRDAGQFWMKPWLSYQLTLIEEEEMIEVTYNSSHKGKEKPSYVLGQVFLMIDGICQSNFPSVEFHCGPACPSETCPGYQDDYFTSLPTAEGNGTRRRHVYDIMPGRQRNQPVYLYCENKCFEDELYEWVPSDK
ncbi:uncharacterized protein [Acropora muricata]|uniref:uncharacterized protein isoform X1 n=1 Tax=Acropora muricata TaxID=159855 RepID=UPI0034E58356